MGKGKQTGEGAPVAGASRRRRAREGEGFVAGGWLVHRGRVAGRRRAMARWSGRRRQGRPRGRAAEGGRRGATGSGSSRSGRRGGGEGGDRGGEWGVGRLGFGAWGGYGGAGWAGPGGGVGPGQGPGGAGLRGGWLGRGKGWPRWARGGSLPFSSSFLFFYYFSFSAFCFSLIKMPKHFTKFCAPHHN